jgi:glycosyltransferase involved in cell wall biosynthesis
MKSNPLVTVLMPVYNGGEYLRLSIESILRQTYKDFEFLIINDCSTDDSLDTIRSIRDPRIRIHSNQENIGQTKSLNVGLKLAKGKYIIINDADDLSEPRRIEKQLDFITKHPEYPVVGASAYIMDKSGRINRIFSKPTDTIKIQLWILSDTPMIHGAVIMNKEIILAEGGYDEYHITSQDFEFWSRLMMKGYRITNVPDILVVIRHYTDSMSFKASDRQTTESGKIFQANINGLTDLNISMEEAVRHRIFFVAPERLTEEDFRKAEELVIQVYLHLKSDIRLDQDSIFTDLREKLIKPYAKLAIAKFKEGQLGSSREIIRRYLSRYGKSRLLLLIWLLSFMGRGALGPALSLHDKYSYLSVAMSRVSGRIRGNG